LARKTIFDAEKRSVGLDHPPFADTMIGLKRLDNIAYCISEIAKNKIEGDFIETGVWRGGAVILMQALRKVWGMEDKNIWVADSFEGLPIPDHQNYTADRGDDHHTNDFLAVDEHQVQRNFEKYHLWDDHIRVLKGWFKDTLPSAPIEKLSLIRLDGDMYQSTMDGLVHLYPKLAKGGYIIVDDWGAVEGCRQAVIDFRSLHHITEPMVEIDWAGIYWKKEADI